jgi:hypothetical protein
VQGTPLQQLALVMQTCPYAAQPPPEELPLLEDEPLLDPLPLPEELPPDELPPDDELLVPQGPHAPFVLPGATLHVVPGQQSLVVVHAPPHETHVPPKHW